MIFHHIKNSLEMFISKKPQNELKHKIEDNIKII